MMDSEKQNLMQMLVGTAEVMGQAMSPSAAAIIVSDLVGTPAHEIARALKAIRATCKTRLTYAVIREQLDKSDGRPEPSEAWALALQSLDESASVVWTDDIARSLAAARPVLDAGDKVGARMAFMQAYERIVQAARNSKEPAKWELSMGWDQEGRALALEQAVQLGRIPVERAKQLGHGGHLQLQAPTPDAQAIVGLIAGRSSGPHKASQDVAAKLARLREIIRKIDDGVTKEREARASREREWLEDAKRKAAAAVESVVARG